MMTSCALKKKGPRVKSQFEVFDTPSAVEGQV